jgi:hypothetical protein
LLTAFLAIAAVALILIAATRGLQSLLDLFVSWPRAVYISYLAVGGILCLAGVLVLRMRRVPDV